MFKDLDYTPNVSLPAEIAEVLLLSLEVKSSTTHVGSTCDAEKPQHSLDSQLKTTYYLFSHIHILIHAIYKQEISLLPILPIM